MRNPQQEGVGQHLLSSLQMWRKRAYAASLEEDRTDLSSARAVFRCCSGELFGYGMKRINVE
jgi:hypothetical protein